MSTPALRRLLHQVCTDCRHFRYGILAWCLWLALRHWQRLSEMSVAFHDSMTTATACLGAMLVFLCVRSDSPSSPESQALTRPLGRRTLWLAKALFILLAPIFPWLIAESLIWRGFDHPIAQWCALIAGALLSAGIVSAVAAFIAASTRSITQTFILGIATMAGIAYLSETDSWMRLPNAGARDSGGIIASLLLLGGVLVATWLCFVPRRNGLALLILLISIFQQPFTESCWSLNWLKNPPQTYPKAKLSLKVLKADPADKTHRQHLWPKIRLHGLERDEVATVLDFAPILPGQPWPTPSSYTDLKSDSSTLHWLRSDHIRVIQQLDGKNALWSDSGAHSTSRPELPSVFEPWKLDPTAPVPAARLRLAVHRVRHIATLPLRDLRQETHRFIIHPGLRVELPPIASTDYGNWEIHGAVQRQHSRLLPDVPHARIHHGTRPLVPSFILTLHDPDLREVTAIDASIYKGQVKRPVSHPWQFDEDRVIEFSFHPPEAQFYLLQTSREAWIDRQTASLWHAEERGVVELELTSEQMAQVLPEPPPKKAKEP
jgi:hypothetical protein